MKIAFLGKGGSGKTTMATATVRYLHKSGKRVLAIDADHNMDLMFNLGVDSLPHYLGADPGCIKRSLGLPETTTYADARDLPGAQFTLTPPDIFTAHVSVEVEPDLLVMAAGPHTDVVRSGNSCSHSLSAPLKVYLPLLKLTEGEAVVIDERAGTDPVATGILQGVDLAIIVREPTVHSTRVASQIQIELQIAGIRHVVVDNKIAGFEADAARMTEAVLETVR